MNFIIGLIGAKGAGKTTAFNTIKEVMEVSEITLAAKLKDTCAKVYGIPREDFDSHKKKEVDFNDPIFLNATNLTDVFSAYGIRADFDKFVRPHIGQVLHTPRQVAQYIGTEVLRAYQDNIHCTSAPKAAAGTVGVVTDMRFPNELAYFAATPRFISIYIQNLGAEIESSKDSHASERYLKDLARQATMTIPNNGSVKEFQDKVRHYIKEVANGS